MDENYVTMELCCSSAMRSSRSSAWMDLSSPKVDKSPDNRGSNDNRIKTETTTAAVASASSDVTPSASSATVAATITAMLRNVSAKTCCATNNQ